MDFDVIVIGGGASGLFCALTAGQRGRKALVLEGSNKPGKKILMSGGGRCNFTNLYIRPECFLSSNPHFCKSALSRYTQWDFINLVESHNIAYEERKHGQLFCKGSSKEILAMLIRECDLANVTLHTHSEVTSIKTTGNTDNPQYIVSTNLGRFVSSRLVIASGGLSIPKMGASNFAYRLASDFNLELIPTSAALVPFTFGDALKDVFDRLTGVTHEVVLSTSGIQFRENILFTHRGLSGPAALQLSTYWNPGDSIVMNLFPDKQAEFLIQDAKRNFAKSLLRNYLSQFLPKKLVLELQNLYWLDIQQKPLADIPDKRLAELFDIFCAWTIKPSGTEGYRTAEVTKGGISTDVLSSKTMECKTQPGLYFIGEAVDVTGRLGGFNFQWAWSSGYVAGIAA